MNQIDHIRVSHSQRNSLLDVRSFRGADIELIDNYFVIANFRMRLRKVNKRMAPKLFESAKLKNVDVKANFTLELEDKFQSLNAANNDTCPIKTKLYVF